MVNIGIIGAGSYGAQHARAIADLDNVHLIAASRTSPDQLAQFVAQYGGKGYTDYHDLLAADDVDAVVIATPHHHHTAIVEAAAYAGKHILLEKPMAPTPEECERILKARDEANVVLLVGHINQFAPAYMRAKEMLDAGEMGEIAYGISTMSKFWFESNRRDWHLNRATGGGMWLTAGIHCLDRLTWLVGSPVISTSASVSTRFHDQNADDAGMIFLRYENGAAGTVVSTGYADGAPKHLTELTCTRGMLNIDYTGGISIGRAEKWKTVYTPDDDDWMHAALVNEWRAFLRAVVTGETPAVTGEYARHIMAVIFAAEESSRLGREVAVTYQPPRVDS